MQLNKPVSLFWIAPIVGAFFCNFSFAAPSNFSEAKILAKRIYADHKETFYCQCPYDASGKVALEACGFQSRDGGLRSLRLEWEHIVPAVVFGRERSCWREKLCMHLSGKVYGGRRCCQKLDANFRSIEADLHNLVPVIGEVNQGRAHFSFTLIKTEVDSNFGACRIKIDPVLQIIEPPIHTRGMIARIYRYMGSQYQIHFSKKEEQQILEWDRAYPPDRWEIERDRRIEREQGNFNPYVRYYDTDTYEHSFKSEVYKN